MFLAPRSPCLEQPYADTSSCSRHFTAPDKPKSFVPFDETGLLGAVCRHGIPLHYLDIFEGERYAEVTHVIKKILDECQEDTRLIVSYDVGCRLRPYIPAQEPALLNRVHCMLNALCICSRT